ncbi:MAG: hypothetical protein A2148_08465 [Chloroflexi bacterium RBG_16_68_14]|nr:MAG: hypothetical protein A2148_08465 [Chloroflexi bacterium RBG_16_68_14]
MGVVSEQDARRYHGRLQMLGFTWSLDDVLQEAGRLAQPGERPTGVVSRALDDMLSQDGFKKK